jgi:hypothetical protein
LIRGQNSSPKTSVHKRNQRLNFFVFSFSISTVRRGMGR